MCVLCTKKEKLRERGDMGNKRERTREREKERQQGNVI